MLRNSLIVADCDMVVAFWDGRSRGTLDTITKAVQAGKRVEIPRQAFLFNHRPDITVKV